jgi:hypothetical protein
MEHMAFKYRVDIEKQMGVDLPKDDDDLPEELETRVARLAAEAAPLVLQMHSQKAAQEAAAQQAQDPAVQAQQQDMQIKTQTLELKAKTSIAELALKRQVEQSKDERERARIESQERIAGLNVGKSITQQKEKLAQEQKLAGFQAGVDIRKNVDQQNNGRPLQEGNAKANERVG